MDWRVWYVQVGRRVIEALCVCGGYEIIAIETHKVPTITCLAHLNRQHLTVKLLILFLLSWVGYHLVFETPSPEVRIRIETRKTCHAVTS